MDRVVSSDSCPSEAGSVPVNEFEDMRRAISSDRYPKEAGSVPCKL